ncbi:MAG TPA: hypothetical protein VF202_02160 [Trueperaceae bacterium]
MANVVVDPGSLSFEEVSILDADGVTLESFPLIAPGRAAAKLNVRGAQAHESDEQTAFGDGRELVGEAALDVLITPTSTKTAHQRLADLLTALKSAAALAYDGVTREIAASTGVTAWQPVGLNDIRATIGYIPTTLYAEDDNGDKQIGPI